MDEIKSYKLQLSFFFPGLGSMIFSTVWGELWIAPYRKLARVDIKYHSIRNRLRMLYAKDSLYMQLSEERYFIIWFAFCICLQFILVIPQVMNEVQKSLGFVSEGGYYIYIVISACVCISYLPSTLIFIEFA